jgi:hypothetical protein
MVYLVAPAGAEAEIQVVQKSEGQELAVKGMRAVLLYQPIMLVAVAAEQARLD